MGQLLENGYDIRINKGVCTISDTQKGLIAKVNMTPNHLFPLNIKCENLLCSSSMMNDDDRLWYMRFVHINFGSLKLLAKKKMVLGLPHIIFFEDKTCEACILGKQHQDNFPIEKS